MVTNRFGVLLGSNLSPLLFLIYRNDTSNALNTISRLFADDTCLAIHTAKPSILRGNINHELLNVYSKGRKPTKQLLTLKNLQRYYCPLNHQSYPNNQNTFQHQTSLIVCVLLA